MRHRKQLAAFSDPGAKNSVFQRISSCVGRLYRRELCAALSVLAVSCSMVTVRPPAEGTIVINPSVTYQTITGWEAWADDEGLVKVPEAYANGKGQLFKLAYDAGVNRLRLPVAAGTENPVDYYSPYLAGHQPDDYWTDQRYNIVNDNSDPFTINSNGFQFARLDYMIEALVLPLKAILAANREGLYLNLNYVDFGPSAFEHSQHPDEYAEFILATVQHMDSEYGLVPDAIEVKLEPDSEGRGDSTWQNGGGRLLGELLVAAGDRLRAHGYAPDFIAPSTITDFSAIEYFDGMIRVPRVLQYLTEISYHRYLRSGSSITTIAARGRQFGLNTSMLEWWDGRNTYHTLHEDLEYGNVSAWQQGSLAGPAVWESATAVTEIDEVRPAVLHEKTRFTRQYYKFIRAGAFRIGATSNNGAFDPLAFVNLDGRYVTVVKASAGGSFSIAGLSAGNYGIKYTTESEYDVDLTDQTIASGQALSTAIPAEGVITVYAKSASRDNVAPAPPADVTAQ